MLNILKSSWWTLVARGLVLVLLGFLAFVNPTGTAAGFVLYAAILLMFEGAFTAGGAVLAKSRDENRWAVLLEGLLTLVFGIILFRSPDVVLLGVALLFGAWMLFNGISKIVLAIQLRKEMDGELWLGLAGVLGIAFAIFIFAQPAIGLATLMAVIGVFALLSGILLIGLGLKLRTFHGKIREGVSELKSAVAQVAQNSDPTKS